MLTDFLPFFEKVLTEVRDAPRTLRKAAPLAAAAITVLYVLANIAYVSARARPRLP